MTDLKTEHLAEPLGIETPHPRFRWLLASRERGQVQTAYQILVATSLKQLQAGIGDNWDSGRVRSDNSVEVAYAGRDLASGERAYWKVRIWDAQGRPSAYSAPAFFEMGLRRASDWQGHWIAAAKDISSPLLRREFALDAPVRRARVYVSGLGHNEIFLNGTKVGDRVLDPAPTYYHNIQPFFLGSRVLYATYDVTAALRKGANAVGVMLGHGWYSGEADAPFRTAYGDRPRLIFQLNIELADGRTLRVVSDTDWKTAPGPITYNDLAHGETYDARLEQPGWDRAGFNDAAWDKAALAEPPSGRLTAQLLPPRRVMVTLPVVKRITLQDPLYQFLGTSIYDFGQQFSGWVRLAVSGPRGATLVLRYGARLYPEDQTLDTRSNEPLVAGARQTDTYILKGEGTEIWEPRFTLHGFRYVEVTGFGNAPAGAGPLVQRIEGRVVRSAVDSTGSFVSSHNLLNRIHRNIQWTFQSSLQGIPQDAADRAERMGFLGDPGFTAEDYIYNYDMVGFWEKWLEDIKDSQQENGNISFISPGNENEYRVWPSWQSTYPLLVWYLYQYYGDQRVVATHYTSVKRLVDFLSTAATGHLIAEEKHGDHMEPQAEGFSRVGAQHTPTALTANAYYYYDVVLLARMAEVLDRPGDALRYQRLARAIKAAFNHRFLNATTSQYATGSQTANALALYLGLVPPERISAVMKNVVEDIITKHDYHVSTGIIGSNAIVQVLPQHGAADLMYQLATQTTYPSLGHQVMMGATTVCETYECGPWTSQNMKMFGSLDKFFYRNVAGIQLASPGYSRVRIQPQPVGDLHHVTATHQTVRGTVSVDWTKEATSFELKVSIPPGMEVEIALPTLGLRNVQITEGKTTVWQSNTYVAAAAGVTGAQAAAEEIVVQAGSGSYHFTLTGTAR